MTRETTGLPPELLAAAGERLWRSLVDGVPYHIALVSLDGRLLYLNHTEGPAPPEGYVGRRVSELTPLGNPAVAEALHRILANPAPADCEIPVTVASEIRWFRVRSNPIRDPEGRIIAILAAGHDITESRQTAIELRMSVNALHRLVEAREQLAADLHDGILQSLYGIGLRLEAARAALTAAGDQAETHVTRAIGQVNETMAEIRRFIRNERESGSLAVRWEDMLAGLLRGLEVSGGAALVLEVSSEAAARVPDPVRPELAFIAREAVSNAMRHSDARQVVVRLGHDGARVRLEIEDDGRGFADDARADGTGLLTMTRRAGQIGAILSVDTEPGRGTRVRVDLPLSGGTGR